MKSIISSLIIALLTTNVALASGTGPPAGTHAVTIIYMIFIFIIFPAVIIFLIIGKPSSKNKNQSPPIKKEYKNIKEHIADKYPWL